jgi:serine/threonine-protein kinase RsbW
MLIDTENYTIKLQSVPESLSKLTEILDYSKATFNLSEEAFSNIELVLGEAINNAIMHGNKGNKNKFVTVAIENNNAYVTYKVVDEGEGFNYNNIADPTLPENIENPTGRGVFIMKSLADIVLFSKKGSIVELLFKL